MPLWTSVVLIPWRRRALSAKARLATKFASGIAFGRLATRVVFTRSSAIEMMRAAGFEPVRRTYNPGLARPLVPLAKKLLGGEGGDPSAILESTPYRVYLKTAYPIERTIARAWPGMLAFQMIFEARPA